MSSPVKSVATRAVLLVGVFYALTGVVFGALAGEASNHRSVVAWRWAAWLVSATAFGAHILYERVHLRAPPRVAALHVAAGAALGAFGLALAANIHSATTPPHQLSLLLLLSLAIWPLMTAVPAFAVALVGALLVSRTRRSA